VIKSFTLYFSSFKMYENCSQQFLWTKGWGNIDLGRGPGRGKARPVKRSEHHAVMGTAIQAVIELFYNEELWRLLPPDQLRDRLLELAIKETDLEIAKRYIDWRQAIPLEEMRQLIRDGVMGYIRTLKAQMFLGPYAKSEVELLAYINKWNPVGGRVDMIIRRDDTGITILDGKNGKRYKDGKGGWMTFTDPDQLRWYAMLFYLCYQKLPDRLGFVYFRYPAGDPVLDLEGNPTGEKEEGVTWVPFSMDDLKGLAQRAVDCRKGLEKEQFEANPSWKQCKFCDFETVCPERMAQKESNRRKPRKKKDELKLTEFSVFTMGAVPKTDGSE